MAYRPRIGGAARRRLQEHQRWLQEHEPHLQVTMVPEGGSAEIAGTLRLRVGGGIPRDFQIQLVYQRSHDGALDPFRPPDTYETGGRLPRGVPERHIEGDGRFCLWLPITAPADFDSPNGLALHLDRVRQFLKLQLLYEDRVARGLTPAWPGPEWKHGLEGYRQWAREHASSIDPVVLPTLVLAVLDIYHERRSVHPASPCPCRSGRIWKVCHSAWAGLLLRAMKDPYGSAVLDELCKLLKDNDDQEDD